MTGQEGLLYRAGRKLTHVISGAALGATSAFGANSLNRKTLHFVEPFSEVASVDALEAIEGTGRGRRAVILGTAPSVRDVDLESISDAYVLCLNRAFLLRERLMVNPGGLIISNPYAAQEYGEEAASQPWESVFLSGSAGRFVSVDRKVVFSQWEAPRMDSGFFQFDCRQPLYQAGTVAHSALQLLTWMGFSQVVTVGVDLMFPLDDPHFYKTEGAELSRSQRASQRNAEAMARGFEIAKSAIEGQGGVELLNAGKMGTKNPFRHVDWGQVFG